jgi:hypothetical protein
LGCDTFNFARSTTMTAKANISLSELAEKGADADLLREMIQYVAQRMMDMDVESLCAAGYAERSPECVFRPK